MADGATEAPATVTEHEPAAEGQQHSEVEQTAQHEQHEQEEQNGATTDVPIPGTEPVAPVLPGMFQIS